MRTVDLFFKTLPTILLFVGLSCYGLSAAEIGVEQVASIPGWQKSWANPGVELRPLQIIHGYFGVNKARWAHPYLAFGHFDGKTIAEGMNYLRRDCGLGGVVCNVSSYKYLQDDEEWSYFVEAVRQAKANGLRVWIYDEDRYPSLAAGGLVLTENPKLEAKELAYDETKADPFLVRDCFEYTHASNNFAYIRRYPSIVSPEAGQTFIRLTHEQYKRRLGPELFGWVEAFFTDEPSTNAVNTGLLPEKVRQGVRTIDSVDPNKPLLPVVVWSAEFPEIYRQMYGEDLMAARKSLFVGTTEADKKVRRQFWQMVAKCSIDAYYGQIKTWCGENGKLASGHGLWEETMCAHTPLDGNKMAVLKTFNIPGMDFLNSTAMACRNGGWKAATIAASASMLSGQRKVFTEISDISTYFNDQPRASVALMDATAAWQAAFGITEFTLYYQITDRTAADYKQYCDFVGRLNAVLRDARLVRDVAIIYPIRELNENYLPIKDRPSEKSATKPVQQICSSYEKAGRAALTSQTTFMLAEESDLPELLAGKRECVAAPKSVLILDGANVSPETQKVLKDFEAQGGKVCNGEFKPETKYLEPASETIIRGEFVRDGKQVQILTNNSDKAADSYTGRLLARGGDCYVLDPATGTMKTVPVQAGRVAISVEPLETRLIIEK